MITTFRPQFWLDLEAGVTYLVENASSEVARLWHAEVLATVVKLMNQPGMGRLRRDLTPSGIRSLVLRRYPRYLLFYRWESGSLEFLRVKHGMMYLPALFDPSQQPPA